MTADPPRCVRACRLLTRTKNSQTEPTLPVSTIIKTGTFTDLSLLVIIQSNQLSECTTVLPFAHSRARVLFRLAGSGDGEGGGPHFRRERRRAVQAGWQLGAGGGFQGGDRSVLGESGNRVSSDPSPADTPAHAHCRYAPPRPIAQLSPPLPTCGTWRRTTCC